MFSRNKKDWNSPVSLLIKAVSHQIGIEFELSARNYDGSSASEFVMHFSTHPFGLFSYPPYALPNTCQTRMRARTAHASSFSTISINGDKYSIEKSSRNRKENSVPIWFTLQVPVISHIFDRYKNFNDTY